MTYDAAVQAFWAAYLDSLPEDAERPASYLAWSFDLTPEAADELGDLVVRGIKTGTASLPEQLDADGEPFPEPGDHHVILDGAGKPLCIIQTTYATVKPFNEVDALHAFSEGEGDRSLAYWREVHERFFGTVCAQLEMAFSETLHVVCERFRVVYPPLAGPVIRPMVPGEESAVIALVERVFDTFVAPAYTRDGALAFCNYASVGKLRERSARDHFVLVAEVGADLAGMIEMRNYEHVSLLFVDGVFQGRGVARALLDGALAIARSQNPGLARVTVNASPNAIAAYERLGFRATAQEQAKHGIRFLPMALTVSDRVSR